MKECDYRNVALASIQSFALVCAELLYMYKFSVLACSVSTDQQEKERKKTTGPRARRIMINRLPTESDYQYRITRAMHRRDRSPSDMTIYCILNLGPYIL